MKRVNSYNLIDIYGNVLYHAVAVDEEHVKELAADKGVDIEGLFIDFARANVRDELGRSFPPYIEDALVY